MKKTIKIPCYHLILPNHSYPKKMYKSCTFLHFLLRVKVCVFDVFDNPWGYLGAFDRCESTFGFCERLCRSTTVDEYCRLFFVLYFDDLKLFYFPNKIIGPGASEKLFGSSGAWPLLGALGPLLGRSWAILGRSWAVHGALLAAYGVPKVVSLPYFLTFCSTSLFHQSQPAFLATLGRSSGSCPLLGCHSCSALPVLC